MKKQAGDLRHHISRRLSYMLFHLFSIPVRGMRVTSVLFIMFIMQQNLTAQVPTGLPTGESEPLPFTLPNILIFIVLPILLFVFYIWWLKQKRKEREEAMQKENEENKKAEESKREEKSRRSEES